MGYNESDLMKKFLILHIALLIYSIGAIFSKLASDQSFLSFPYFFYMGLLFLSLVIYAIVWQQVLKRVPLNVAFANKGITIVWSMIFGYFLFHEKITVMNIVGSLIVIAGIVVMVLGGSNE